MNLSISNQDWLYAFKCTLGAAICYLLYTAFPGYPFFWSIISVVLVISPENDKKLAFIRIEGNLLGSGIGFLAFFLPLPTLIVLSLSIILTIITGIILKLTMGIRSAVAATIIVLFQEKLANSWNIALQRVGSVIVGCIVGLIITVIFTHYEKTGHKKKELK